MDLVCLEYKAANKYKMPICIAILAKGVRCSKNAFNNERCGIHNNSLMSHGPHTTARKELGYLHKKEIIGIDVAFNAGRVDDIEAEDNRTRIHLANKAVRRAEHRRAMAQLVNQQREQIRMTGVDPDAEARQRLRERHRLNAERIRQVIENRIAQDNLVNNLNAIGAAVRIQPRALAAFAADPQNVHTTEAVQQTKDIVDLIRKIPVPEDYRWHPTLSSKTPFEIGMECKLSQKAAWQMISQYAQDTSIYDIDVGIYGKVLDSVWQYIKNSSDKEDLCRIIKRELEDNIGMCAQGNLSRICNVLAGYMEGIGAQESLAERLGRLLPPLMEIEDMTERVRQACIILRENRVPPEEWDTWMEPLLEEEGRVIYDYIREELAI